MRIVAIEFNDGSKVELGRVTALIGPNNTGKSRTLKDIETEIGRETGNGVVARRIITTPMMRDLDAVVQDLGLQTGNGQVWIGSQYDPNSWGMREHDFRTHVEEGTDSGMSLASAIVRRLGVDERLLASRAAPPLDYRRPIIIHPLHGLAVRADSVMPALQEIIHRAFELRLMLDDSSMQEITLRVAYDFPDLAGLDRVSLAQRMAELPSALDQGDGFRSFVGVVLPMLLERRRIILLDEPDAFLHPEQARVLGRWISHQAMDGDNQVIIATHDENLLSGLLTGHPESDLTIIRLNRTSSNTTTVTRLRAGLLQGMTKSPLLSAPVFLNALFQRGVVVVEAPNDRAVYESVAAPSSELGVVFINAQNKQTLKDIAGPLKSAAVPVATIADFDVLNDERVFSDLACVMAPEQVDELVRSRARIFAQNLTENQSRTGPSALTMLSAIRNWLDAPETTSAVCEHGPRWLRNRLVEQTESGGYWDRLKAMGIEALTGSYRAEAEAFLESCAAVGMFIVPTGELESWFGLGKGRESISKMLEAIHTGSAPAALTKFVQSVVRYIITEEPQIR